MTANGLYFMLEDLGLTEEQRAILWTLNDESGDENDSVLPNLRNHWAIRPDDKAKIYEGVFSDLTIGTMTSRLAQAGVLGVPRVSPVPASKYGTEYIFEYRDGSVWKQRMRWIIFSGVNATWEESHSMALVYLADNKEAWGSTELP